MRDSGLPWAAAAGKHRQAQARPINWHALHCPSTGGKPPAGYERAFYLPPSRLRRAKRHAAPAWGSFPACVFTPPVRTLFKQAPLLCAP